MPPQPSGEFTASRAKITWLWMEVWLLPNAIQALTQWHIAVQFEPLFFMDAAHFVFAPFLGYLWCFVRVFIKAPSGRKRFNVLGALNAISHEMVGITNTGYINAYSVCELLIKLSQKYGSLPISIFLDNARYQKCRLVQATAELFDIELLYLPTYSPNLNLIERIWKFVKKKCLNSKYYPDFDSFTKSITEVLAKTNGCYKKELDSLLSLKFKSFKNSKIMAR